MIRERAFAKLNLVLHVGRPRPDGLHPLASLFASLDLADEVTAEAREGGSDEVVCPAVPGRNLAAEALAALREEVDGALPPVRVGIDKRIPVAAGLGGGSADAAATLRAANALSRRPLPVEELRRLAAPLGSDVPSQVEPAHAVVTGVGEDVERVGLAPFWAVLVPQGEGLLAREVYSELDRLGGGREELDPGPLHALSDEPLEALAATVENDLQPAALSLRPELERPLAELREVGAMAAAIAGSGPTAFGLFADGETARSAAAAIDGALPTRGRAA